MTRETEMRAWGYSYDDIVKLKSERDRYRWVLRTLLWGSFGKRPPRGAAMVSMILRALYRR